MTKYIIGEFETHGINVIDLDTVIKDWNHLFLISGWINMNTNESEYTLIKKIRKDSLKTKLKTRISVRQFRYLKKELNLKESRSDTFKSGSIYRQ